MNRIWIICLVCLFLGNVRAQKLTVDDFSLSLNDLTASIQNVKDLNEVPCALIKIWLVDDITRVEGNYVGNLINKGTEKWVFMTQGSKELRIVSKSYLPLHVRFADYGIDKLESKCTYMLILSRPDEVKTDVTEMQDMNNPEQLIAKGECYEFGRGVKRDAKQAFELYQRAANMNYPDGCYRLGNCYLYGNGTAVCVIFIFSENLWKKILKRP